MRSLAGLSTLVIEADALGAKLTSLILRQAGANVTVALDAEQALRELDALRPALVIVDLQLPQVSGLVLARHITQLNWAAQTRIIAVSTRNGQTAHDARSFGCSEFVQKPIDADRLIAAVSRSLGGHDEKDSSAR